MPIHPTSTGFAIRIACDDGTIANYAISDETEHDILCDQLVGNIGPKEARLLRAGLNQLTDPRANRHVESRAALGVRGSRAAAFVRRVASSLIDGVGGWLAGEQEQECAGR